MAEIEYDALGRPIQVRDVGVPAEGDSIVRYRFNAPDYKINEETGCWEWLKSLLPSGYPHGRPYRAYWEAANGPIPDGHDVHHLCKNVICVNPDHLEAIHRREHDVHHFLGERAGGLTLDDVRAIRKLGRVPGMLARHVAAQYGINKRTVERYWEGSRWQEIIGDEPVVPTAICTAPGCGAAFVAYPRFKRYCSPACRARANYHRKAAA